LQKNLREQHLEFLEILFFWLTMRFIMWERLISLEKRDSFEELIVGISHKIGIPSVFIHLKWRADLERGLNYSLLFLVFFFFFWFGFDLLDEFLNLPILIVTFFFLFFSWTFFSVFLELSFNIFFVFITIRFILLFWFSIFAFSLSSFFLFRCSFCYFIF